MPTNLLLDLLCILAVLSISLIWFICGMIYLIDKDPIEYSQKTNKLDAIKEHIILGPVSFFVDFL